MRPLSLTVQAFGSYGEKTTIDFTKPEQNLFLVTGDTGAGKTTIFDAIVFALYGKASSSNNVKDGRDMQSQFVGSDVEPFVELTFSEKNGEDLDIYTVRRVPNHTRAKKRGTGTTNQVEKVSLIMPEGNEYSNNLNETNKKLEEIIGLDKDQFMQVAMIAQGEFMELLRARSNEKKEIFRKLFNTELYDKIVKEMDVRKRNKLSEIGQIRTICQTEAGHAVIPQEAEGSDDLLDLQREIISSDRLNVSVLEDFLERLQSLCGTMGDREAAAQKENEDALRIRDEKRDDLTKAESLLQPFKQLETSKKELDECAALETEMKEAEQTASAIRTAYEIKVVYDRYSEAANKAAETGRKLARQREDLPVLKQKYDEAVSEETNALEVKNAAQEELARTEERVKKALDILKKIKDAKKEAGSAEKALTQASKNAEAAGEELSGFEERVKEWKAQAEELKDADAKLSEWNQKMTEAENIAADVDALKGDRKDIAAQKKKVDKAKKEYASARDEYTALNSEYIEKHNAFLDAQAGFIAREKLVPGKPCPVCGSLEHPSPCAVPEEHQHLTREMIDQLAGEVSKYQNRQETLAGKAQTSEGLLNEKNENFGKNLEKLRERMAKTLPDVPDPMTLDAAESLSDNLNEDLSAEGAVLSENAERLKKLKEDLDSAESKKEELRDRRDLAEKAKATAESDLSGKRTVLEGLEAQKDYPTEAEASAALNAAKAKKEETDAAYEKAKKAAQKAKTDVDGAETLINRYSEELPKEEDERDRRQEEYETILTQYEISETEWKETADRYQKEQADELRKKVEDFGNKKAAAQRGYNNAREQIGDKQRPDLEELEAAKSLAEENQRIAQQKYDEIREQHRANEQVCNNLIPKMEERSRLVQEQNRIDSLYNRLAGKVSGERMDIESFVQRYYLQRILDAANARFREMSGGQFELRMIDEEQAGKGNTNHGLDLTVYSTVTGTEREVCTLSGGESFIAALSLALGMADQIRMNSAAVNLDIMFIDEGFGSLDDHSRNQAVRVLQQMAGGDKLVGIISHVTELKQQIDDQLVVTKDEKGSHAKWQAG